MLCSAPASLSLMQALLIMRLLPLPQPLQAVLLLDVHHLPSAALATTASRQTPAEMLQPAALVVPAFVVAGGVQAGAAELAAQVGRGGVPGEDV